MFFLASSFSSIRRCWPIMMFFSEIVWIMVKRAMSFLDYIFTSTGYFFLNVIRKSVVIHTGLNYKPKIYAIVLNDLLTYKCTHSFNTWKLRSNALLPLKCQLEFKKPYYIILTSFINFCLCWLLLGYFFVDWN